MKKVKNFAFKCMLTGMVFAGGLGSAVATMTSAVPVYAAENETTAQTKEYAHCIKGEEKWWFDYYLQKGGTGYQGADGTYYIYGNGANYEITFTVTEYRTRTASWVHFRTEEEAIEYGNEMQWENVHAEIDESVEEWNPMKYRVYGVSTMGTVTVKTIPNCCPSESME